MNAKQVIQLFIPPIYYKIKDRCVKKSKQSFIPMPKRERKGDKMIAIGNGPSLNKTVELYMDVLQSTECMMVNEACLAPLFEQIRPVAYFLVDPVYFHDDHHEEYLQTRMAVINAILTKTQWSMSIVMPTRAKGCYAVNRFKENPNLDVVFYEDPYTIPQGMSVYEALDKNMAPTPGQTVLNTALWASVYWGYPETYIVGADTSFIQDIYVSQKDNILYSMDTHFFKNDGVYHGDVDPEKHGRKYGLNLEQLLDAVHLMFAAYYQVRNYADWKGVKVYNASEYSMIDCFERKKLRE